MTSRSASGGAASEAGSLHRNGVATFLAAHGLAGVPVGGIAGAVPVRLHLEADESVDDIVCTMASNATWYVQAKRRAGKDKALREAIAQWVAQNLTGEDRVVLASRELRGILRRLQPALDIFARGRGGSLSKTQGAALDELSALFSAAGAKNPKALLKRVRLLDCAVEDAADAQQATAIALLAGTIVRAQDAPAAFDALQKYMQHTAARREWSEPSDWVAAISAAGIQTINDPDGAPGARATADLTATAAYRTALGARLDHLDLSALDPALGLVKATNDLLAGWDVEWGEEDPDTHPRPKPDLWSMVRRNPRFVLSGHPGTGKSEALRQVAARLAIDPNAPLPVLVDVRQILSAIARPDDVSLELLLGQASSAAARVAPDMMIRVLRDAVLSGDAVVLVDGLDEARGKRGIVATGLNELTARLPPETGFILSTRPSGLDAATIVGLHNVHLLPPDNLATSLEALLGAMSRRVPADQRASWLDARLENLRTHAGTAEEIWKIPLLASLATIRIGRDLPPAGTAAGLLNDVVLDSIKAWEQKKAEHGDDFDPAMRPEMLMDAYITIGRLLGATGELTTADALAAVTEHLKDWEMSGRLTALLAEQCLTFWDERVGIFVEHDGALVARSRQFSEIAEVNWIAKQSEPDKRAWVASALEDPDRIHTVRLSASQDRQIRGSLIDAARRSNRGVGRNRAASWLCTMWPDWTLTDDEETAVIDALGDAAEDTLPEPGKGSGFIEQIERGQRKRDGGGWHCAIALARADVTGQHRHQRDARLLSLPVSPARRVILELLINLRDARGLRRVLSPEERDQVNGLLAGPAPAPSTSGWKRGVLHVDASERYITGVGDVVDMAVDHVDELGPRAPEAFFEIASHLPSTVYTRVEAALIEKGFTNPKPLFASKPFFDQMLAEFQDFHGLGWILRHVAAMFSNDSSGARGEMWRRSQLSDFLNALEWGETHGGEMRAAAKVDPAVLTRWFAAKIVTLGLDGRLIATHAREVLGDPEGAQDVMRAVTTAPLDPRQTISELGCKEAGSLTSGFTTDSPWIAEQVFGLVLNLGCPAVADVIGTLREPWYWRPRFLATIAALANTADRAGWIERALAGDSAQRSGLAVIQSQLDGVPPDVIQALKEDRDAMVRHYAGSDVNGAEVWTCQHCYEERPIDEIPCPKCHQHPGWSGPNRVA